ncbi:hypothetical protein [Parabacteroides sp.]|uniref:hypothetical protein n=1 Tax=Parabacteroides sp. TaxID=1869337 RepID=UPI003FF0150F
MNKIGLIIKREYLRRVSKKSFLLLTFLTPFLFAALVFVPLWLSTIKGDDVKQVAISDTTGKYAPLFKDTEEYTFITEKGSSLEEYRKNPDKEIFAFLNITDDLLQNPTAAILYSQKQIPMGLKNTIDKTLSEYLKDEKLASYNIDNLKQIIEESKINFNIKTIKWDEDRTYNKKRIPPPCQQKIVSVTDIPDTVPVCRAGVRPALVIHHQRR